MIAEVLRRDRPIKPNEKAPNSFGSQGTVGASTCEESTRGSFVSIPPLKPGGTSRKNAIGLTGSLRGEVWRPARATRGEPPGISLIRVLVRLADERVRVPQLGP